MDDDVLWVIGLLLAAKVWREWEESTPGRALQRGGAKLYEMTHPSERDHADDLPGKQLTRGQLFHIAESVGFPDPNFAVAIALAESGGVPNALGDGGVSVGLWQINTRAHPRYTRAQMADPLQNARAAFAISKGGSDWTPWSVFKSGRYRDFL